MTGRSKKAVSGAGLTGEVLVLSERKVTVGGSLGCPPWLCFVLQPGKDFVGFSHKKILKYLSVWSGLSIRADFLKDVGPLV